MSDPAIDLIRRFHNAERAVLDADGDEGRLAAADEAWRIFMDLAHVLNASGILGLHLRNACDLGFQENDDPTQIDHMSDVEREKTFSLCATVLHRLALSLADDEVSRRLNDAAGAFHDRIQGSNTAFFDAVVEGRGNRLAPRSVVAARHRLVQIVTFKASLDGSNAAAALESLGIGVSPGTFKNWARSTPKRDREAAREAGCRSKRGEELPPDLQTVGGICERHISHGASILRLARWASGGAPFQMTR